MARKRIKATIAATEPDEAVAYQEVTFQVNDQVIDTKNGPADGGDVTSTGFDLEDNRDNTVKVLVTPVDTAGQRCPVPAVATEVFKGSDTIPPNTPDAPT